MRQLKFRAYWVNVYHSDPRKMIYSDNEWMSYFWDCVFENEWWDIMQYIGIEDVNGKEVYEGDIIKIMDGRVLIVEWSEYKLWWEISYENGEREKISRNPENKFEVIGNIFEDTELFKFKETPWLVDDVQKLLQATEDIKSWFGTYTVYGNRIPNWFSLHDKNKYWNIGCAKDSESN